MSKLISCLIRLLNWICSTKKIFTLVCSALAFYLIYKALFAFSVTKPTTTYKEEKELETIDLPEIVACSDPGLKLEVLERYGYERGINYYFGQGGDGRFVGWNGGDGEQDSSDEIFERSLIIDSHLVTDRRLFTTASYTHSGLVNGKASKIGARTLVYPHGRCVSFSPSASREKTLPSRNLFFLRFNDSSLIASNITTIKIFFMDKTNSLGLYPEDTEMVGDPITIGLVPASPQILGFKTHIFRSKNIVGDPSLDCADYTPHNSYNDCIKNELKKSFNKTIGCVPPPLFEDRNTTMCNRKFNSSRKDEDTAALLGSLFTHDYKFNCKKPCQTNRYSTNSLYKFDQRNFNETELGIVFDKTVEVVHTKFSTDIETLLTGFGGAVSSGRTLLWIVFSLLGASQVRVLGASEVRLHVGASQARFLGVFQVRFHGASQVRLLVGASQVRLLVGASQVRVLGVSKVRLLVGVSQVRFPNFQVLSGSVTQCFCNLLPRYSVE